MTVAGFRVALWVLPWRLVSRAPRLSRRRDDQVIDDTSRAVQAAARFVPAATCLTQALALRALLARRGRPSTLTLGVRHPARSVEAHAWLEADGRIVLGDPGTTPFARLHPPAPAAASPDNPARKA